MIFKSSIHLLLSIALACTALSCDRSLKDVQKIGFSEFVPSGRAEDFNLKYTDSGKITSILVSPLMLDYATVAFPFTEFPDGMHITFYDKAGKFAKEHGFKVIDLRSKENEKYYLRDVMHLGTKGWVDVCEKLFKEFNQQ